MRIWPVNGDIVDEGPKRAELAALWLHGGGSTRQCMWDMRLRRAYGARLRWARSLNTNPRSGRDVQIVCDLGRPWSGPADQLLEVTPPEVTLRYLYVFSNESDSVGYADPKLISNAVKRMMRAVADLQLKRVAMLNILLAARSDDTKRHDTIGAQVMIDALREWDTLKPGLVTDVYLVDLKGIFADCLN